VVTIASDRTSALFWITAITNIDFEINIKIYRNDEHNKHNCWIEKKHNQKAQKQCMIPIANAIIYPSAMMIVAFNAAIARHAMVGSRWSEAPAEEAEVV